MHVIQQHICAYPKPWRGFSTPYVVCFQLFNCLRWLFEEESEDTKRGNQNPYIKEEQTTQWPKEKLQKDKQRSTKHIYKTKDRVTRTPLKTGGELGCSGRVSSSCSTSDIRRVNLVTSPVIRRKGPGSV